MELDGWKRVAVGQCTVFRGGERNPNRGVYYDMKQPRAGLHNGQNECECDS